ncbi:MULTISPECIES: hypothetical protein [Sphingobium]|jgi:hypothetical protein|uniref:hypothetical protein n=1 Tax=Sphingobium TaxID=165695 RepID=UPI002B1CDFD6|nr:hypothetical protein [Sphingobium lactosutens]|tara:strand:- start:273 stop:590 length:318 start_codon:yes stop_codon:yes gene_type:complete
MREAEHTRHGFFISSPRGEHRRSSLIVGGGLTTQAKNPMVGRAAIYPTKTVIDNVVNLKDHNTGRGDHGNGSWQSPVVSGSHNLPLTFMLQYIISSTARARNAQR